MKRLTRISAILIQLQSKPIVTAKDIANRFEVSLRTVYRDIKTLQEAGIPIGSENGVGYFIVDGYKLPPVSITEDEANTLIILENLIKQQGDLSIQKHFESFITKIKSILKTEQKENIEYLNKRTYHFIKDKGVKSEWLSTIQSSIIKFRPLQISYHSIYKDELSQRTIEPLAVYFTNNTWIIIAYCQLRKDLREFRLDRISTLTIVKEEFTSKIEFDLKKYFKNLQT